MRAAGRAGATPRDEADSCLIRRLPRVVSRTRTYSVISSSSTRRTRPAFAALSISSPTLWWRSRRKLERSQTLGPRPQSGHGSRATADAGPGSDRRRASRPRSSAKASQRGAETKQPLVILVGDRGLVHASPGQACVATRSGPEVAALACGDAPRPGHAGVPRAAALSSPTPSGSRCPPGAGPAMSCAPTQPSRTPVSAGSSSKTAGASGSSGWTGSALSYPSRRQRRAPRGGQRCIRG